MEVFILLVWYSSKPTSSKSKPISHSLTIYSLNYQFSNTRNWILLTHIITAMWALKDKSLDSWLIWWHLQSNVNSYLDTCAIIYCNSSKLSHLVHLIKRATLKLRFLHTYVYVVIASTKYLMMQYLIVSSNIWFEIHHQILWTNNITAKTAGRLSACVQSKTTWYKNMTSFIQARSTSWLKLMD